MKAKDLRKGNVIIYNNAPHRVMDFHHHTPGNLRAMVQTKLRNVISGSMTDVRFSSTEDVPSADVYQFDATYLFHDAAGYHFMNSETYDEVVLSEAMVGDGKYYLLDNTKVGISTYNEDPIGVEFPQTVVLTIAETEPGLKGATVTNVQKPATTETGLVVQVPPFIKIGEKVIISTEDGRYMSRAD